MDELGELVNRSLAREYGLRVLYAGDSASDIIPNGGITTPELSIWMPRSFICAYNKIRTGKPSRRLPELAQLWSDIKPHIIGKGLTARSEPYSRMAVDVVVPEFERWEGLPHAWVDR